MNDYHFEEHGRGYKIGQALQPWRPQFPVIVSWINKGAKVLDVGCGDGVLGEKLIKEKKCRVVGIDLDETGVLEAIRRGLAAQVLDIDEGLPFGKKSFEVVVCNEILQYVKNPNFVVSELLRVGERVIISFPNFGFWVYRFLFLLGRFPFLALFGHGWWEAQLTRYFSLSDFYHLPAIKGVRIKRMICIDWKNRKVSFLARFWPNFFGRSCILELKKG